MPHDSGPLASVSKRSQQVTPPITLVRDVQSPAVEPGAKHPGVPMSFARNVVPEALGTVRLANVAVPARPSKSTWARKDRPSQVLNT